MEWILGILGASIVAFVTAKITTRQDFARLREEQKFDYSLEAAIVHLLENPAYKKRSLKKLKYHLRGFETDDILRQALIRAGAVAFGGEGDEERWGLLRLNQDDVK